MKKLLVWVLGIALVGVIAVVAAGYFAYRAAQPALETARGYLTGFGEQIDDLEKKVANQQPFGAPGGGELTKEQVERFVRVQQSVMAALGQRARDLQTKYEHLKPTREGAKAPSVAEFMGAFSELSGVIVDARRAQVEALNQEKFSSAEYDWVRKQFYQAAGVNTINRRLTDLQKLVRSNEGASVAETTVVNAPPANRELVKPYQRDIDDWLPLLFFGL